MSGTEESAVAAVENGSPVGHYLTFRIGDSFYGMDVNAVEVVLESQPITRVPNCRPWIRGVTNHRGAVIPVVDIGAKFGFGSAADPSTRSIIVLQSAFEGERIVVGMLADAVREVLPFQADEIDTTPRIGGKRMDGLVTGIGKKNDDFILLIDVESSLREGVSADES